MMLFQVNGKKKKVNKKGEKGVCIVEHRLSPAVLTVGRMLL